VPVGYASYTLKMEVIISSEMFSYRLLEAISQKMETFMTNICYTIEKMDGNFVDLCKIGGFHGCDYAKWRLLGC
jgi:hypothetical protein